MGKYKNKRAKNKPQKELTPEEELKKKVKMDENLKKIENGGKHYVYEHPVFEKYYKVKKN